MERCMTSQFSMAPYSGNMPNYPQGYVSSGTNVNKNQSVWPSVLGMAALGAIGGGSVGYYRNRYPVANDGTVSDTFARKAFKAQVKKGFSEEGKAITEQTDNILKKIDWIRKPDKLKKLLRENQAALQLKEMGISIESYLSTINEENLKIVKNSIKENLNASRKNAYERFATLAKACWNSTEKKFVKPDGMEDSLFNIIKKSNATSKWAKAGKYGGITAGIAGLLTLGYKMLAPRN